MCNWGRNGPLPQPGESPQDYKRRCERYNLDQPNAMAFGQQTIEGPEQATSPTRATITAHDDTDDDFEYLGPFRLGHGFGTALGTPPASSASPFRDSKPPNTNGASQFDGLPPPAGTTTRDLRGPIPKWKPHFTPGLDVNQQPRTHGHLPGPYEFLELPAAAPYAFYPYHHPQG